MRRQKTVNVALQGGGSHGAFAWGVLDRLLEEPGIAIEGAVGTSSGAMNAAVLAYGLAIGGAAGAREKLAEFWRAVADAARLSPLLNFYPGYQLMEAMARVFSPYELNPLNLNPLRGVLERTIDFGRLRAEGTVKLYLCASNVRTGRLRVFERSEASAEAVLASACLPQLFQAVEIDGEHYWDGGYMGNPPLFPLVYGCDSRDVVLVMVNPIEIDAVPTVLDDATSVMDIGIVLGAFVAAALAGRLAPSLRVSKRSLTTALIGGLLMGYGARLAYGCNISAFFSGISSTSLHGRLWIAAALPGNWIGARLRPQFGLAH